MVVSQPVGGLGHERVVARTSRDHSAPQACQHQQDHKSSQQPQGPTTTATASGDDDENSAESRQSTTRALTLPRTVTPAVAIPSVASPQEMAKDSHRSTISSRSPRRLLIWEAGHPAERTSPRRQHCGRSSTSWPPPRCWGSLRATPTNGPGTRPRPKAEPMLALACRLRSWPRTRSQPQPRRTCRACRAAASST